MDQDQSGADDDCIVILDDDEEEEISVSKDAYVDCIVIDDDEEEEISDSKGRIKTESELDIPYDKGDGYNLEECQGSSPPLDIRNEDTTTAGTSSVGPKPALGEESVVQEHSFQCSDCGKNFKYLHQLTQHSKTHKGERPFECDRCTQTFKKADHLERHILRHLGEKNFTCSVCGKSFTEFYELKKHSKLHFKERPYQCSQCGKGYTELSVLKGHLAMHARKGNLQASKRKYRCKICGEDFLVLQNLKFHRQYAHQEQKTPPKIPEGVKININEIEKDKTIKNSQFDCSECGKSFGVLVQLKSHLKAHGMIFQCSQCLEGFKELSDLKLHLATHPRKIEYRCLTCGRDFHALGNLNFHLQYSHKDPEEQQTINIFKVENDKSFKNSQFDCTECGKSFCTASHLKKHSMSHAKLFKCSQCGKGFSRHKLLVKHLLEHE